MTQFLLLYLLFLKATLSSFSGMTALPILREDLVVTHRITDRQLPRSHHRQFDGRHRNRRRLQSWH